MGISKVLYLKMMNKKTELIIFPASAVILLIIFVFFLVDNKKVKPEIAKPDNTPTPHLFSQPEKVKLILGGDVMLGRSVLTKADRLDNYTYPLAKILPYLSGADMVFVNLESPFLDNCPRTNGGMLFCSDPKMVNAINTGNMVVNLANNHILNFKKGGLDKTKTILEENNIGWTGFGSLYQKRIKGTTFGFLGFDFVSQKANENDLNLIREADKQVDVLVVGVHWGEEYQDKSNKFQKTWAQALVDAGAEVVAGHHPHWVQEMQMLNNGRSLVFYSLGNLVFDQMWSEETKTGELAEIIITDGRITEYFTRRTYIGEIGQPDLSYGR